MTERATLKEELVALLDRGMQPLADDAFNRLALRCFRFQFDNNAAYRKYCERRLASMDTVRHWLDVPAVPTAAFKATALVAGNPADAAAIFRTSGTTHGAEKRGAHYVLEPELYERSLLPAFKHFVLKDRAPTPMAALVAQWQDGAESSLGYMVTTVLHELGTPDSCFAIDADGLDHERLRQYLHARIQANQPVCLIGTSLAFVHWFELLRTQALSFQLPRGSRIMDTGGFKGSQRTITSTELRAQYTELLGVPQQFVINEYGMTEMLSQFYDAHLHDPALQFVKQGPPWVRSAVVDPETLEPLPRGQEGLLRHFDLANLFSVSAIQTEDVGRMHPHGFELLGRATGAAPRGCSIAMDMFLSATSK